MVAPATVNHSTRRLSEVAKHLIIPDGIKRTGWLDVRDTCAEKLGIEYDGWQDGAGQLLLAEGANGRLIHTVGGYWLSVPRQIGKTYYLAGSIFGLSVNHPGLLSIWSAHHSKTHSETFLAMQEFSKRTMVKPHIHKVYTGAGTEEVRFANGSRILFGARERGFGRGIPGVDILVFDEAQILSERAMQNILPTINTSRLGLHVYCGTPPKPEDMSERWMRTRDNAISGKKKNMVWIEMGADEGARLDDHKQWMKANCSVPYRTPFDSMERMREGLTDDGFYREALGVYDEDDGSVFDTVRWAKLADLDVEPPDRAVLCIDVAPDRSWASIGVAGELEDGRTLLMVYSMRGISGVVPKVVEMQEKRDILEVAIFAGGQARALEPDLVQAGIEYEKLFAAEMGAAQASLQEAIKASIICHVDQAELNMAIANAKTRYLMSGESEQFDRRGRSSIDLSPAVACAGAFYRWGMVQSPMPTIF